MITRGVAGFLLPLNIVSVGIPDLALRAGKGERQSGDSNCAGVQFRRLLLLTQHNDVWEIAAAGLFAGACFSATSPLSLSLLMVGTPKRHAGRAMGTYGAAEDVGISVGPRVGSAIWVQFGLTAAYLTLSASFLAVLVPCVVAMRGQPPGPKR